MVISDTYSADFTSVTFPPSSLSTNDEETGLVLSLREAFRKVGTEAKVHDRDSESTIEWDEPE